MRKLTTAILTMLILLLLTACNSDQKAVTEAAEGFLNALVKNDKDAAAQYATEEFMQSETMKFMDAQYLSDVFFDAMGVTRDEIDEEAQKAVDDYEKLIIERAYKDYEIQDIKIQDNKAYVTAKITLGYDPEASRNISKDTQKIIDDYKTENYDELMSICKEKGERAMYRKLYSDLIPIIIGKMQEQLESESTAEEKTILSLEKIDKKWLVTDLEENRTGAAPVGSTEESADTAATSTEYASTSATQTEYASEYMTGATNEEAEETEPDEGATGGTAGEAAEEEPGDESGENS
ncbi:MAG: hypothetical protein IJ110_06655 [Lachnospiraceae bacterium]|nr:hypothetical protein [Lachnospiraceae bacterium]